MPVRPPPPVTFRCQPVLLSVSLWMAGAVWASEAGTVDFVRDVRPIFQKHCYECHGEKKQKGGLRLDVRAEALKGGSHGPDIVPGKAEESRLIHLVTAAGADEDEDGRMPPEGERLSPARIGILTTWINEGAVWPEGADMVRLKDKRDHWSFKPLAANPAPPTGPSGPSSSAPVSIDTFIEAALREKGLAFSPPADRAAWLRRVTFDLTGLPPAPEEVADFVKDTQSGAAERVVERLLASPRYGERQAQHWLDVVRYADTHGFEVNTERPNAWPYRDYVIDAFNAGTPYDRFIREQIAGDTLGTDAATGFLVTASVLLPGQIGQDEPSKRLARQDALDEIVNNIGQTFLGLSIGCARCHDHKFDPVTARDYYAMQAFVAGVEYEDRELRTPEAEAARRKAEEAKLQLARISRELTRFIPLAGGGVERPMVNARENVDRFAPVKARRLRFTIRATNNLEPCLDELEVLSVSGANVALAKAGAVVSASGSTEVGDRHSLKFLNDGEYGNSRSWMGNETGKGRVTVEFAQEETIDRVLWGRDRREQFTDRLATDYLMEVADASGEWKALASAEDRRRFDPKDQQPWVFTASGLGAEEAAEAGRLIREKEPLEATLRTAAIAQQVFAGIFRKPDGIHLLNRGDPEQPKEEVPPAVPAALGDLVLTTDTPERQRREALAGWIASPENPLTARVMVNRLWQGHFGTGLVQTPSDFGNNGMPPTHPALLDWLAAEFIRSGWSVKHMHRLMVLSRTYGQCGPGSSLGSPAAAVDAEARLLWCFPSRRLEAEAIRDSMLTISGLLNLKMHGPGYDLFNQRGGLSGFNPVETFTGDGLRRMIYAHKVRRETEAVFGAFDCPDAGQSTAARRASTTPIQALNLFNSRFTLDQSEAFAARIIREAGGDIPRQVTRAWQLALSRGPGGEELEDASAVVSRHGLALLCRALFNSNEFLFPP